MGSAKRVLSIQSHVVSGYVGNKCAVFTLQILGFDVDPINAVQFSNHGSYPTIKGSRTSREELRALIDGLKENDLLNYSHLLTGYIGSVEFLQEIAAVVQDLRARDRAVTFGKCQHL
jgi:pyridoxine kinase